MKKHLSNKISILILLLVASTLNMSKAIGSGQKCSFVVEKITEKTAEYEAGIFREFESMEKQLNNLNEGVQHQIATHGADKIKKDSQQELSNSLIDFTNISNDLKKELEALEDSFISAGEFSKIEIANLKIKIEKMESWVNKELPSFFSEKSEYKKEPVVAKTEVVQEKFVTLSPEEWEAMIQNPLLIKAEVEYKIPTIDGKEFHAVFSDKVVSSLFDAKDPFYHSSIASYEKTLEALKKGFNFPSSGDGPGAFKLDRDRRATYKEAELFEVRIIGKIIGRFRMGGYRIGSTLHLVHWSFDSNHESMRYKQAFRRGIKSQMYQRGH